MAFELNERLTWQLLRRFYGQPERLGRHQYLRRLRWSDHEFMKRLKQDGASTADELSTSLWVRQRRLWGQRNAQTATTPTSETAFTTMPSLETVRDWLTLAWRRGLIEVFDEQGRASAAPEHRRWALTAKGEQQYRRPTSSLRIATTALHQLAKGIVWLIGLVVGSALLLESVRTIDASEITGSTAFELSAAVLGAALLLLLLAALFEYVRRVSALGLIELTRRYGEVAALDGGETSRSAGLDAPPGEKSEPRTSKSDQ